MPSARIGHSQIRGKEKENVIFCHRFLGDLGAFSRPNDRNLRPFVVEPKLHSENRAPRRVLVIVGPLGTEAVSVAWAVAYIVIAYIVMALYSYGLVQWV